MNRFSHSKPLVTLVSRAKLFALLVAGAALAAGCSSMPQVDGPLIISLTGTMHKTPESVG